MKREQSGPSPVCTSQPEQEKTREARHEQHGQKRDIHADARLIL